MRYIPFTILCIYYAIALVLRASYNETALMYYSVLFYPLAAGVFLWMAKDSKTWQESLKAGLIWGAGFGLFAGIAEIVIYHLMEGLLTDKFGLVIGYFIDGFNHRFITYPLLRIIIYTLFGAVAALAGFSISRMRLKPSKKKE